MMITVTKFVRYVIERFEDHRWQQVFDEYETLGDAQAVFDQNVASKGGWDKDDWRFVRLIKSVQREVL